MSSTVVLVLHRQQSCPGRVAALLTRKGYGIDIRRPALGDPLPEDFSQCAGAVVFGGPMSANDEHLPFIRQEIDWIGRLLAAGTPYLGICLGAQLLARQLGGTVSGHTRGRVEVGFHPIEATNAGAGILPSRLHVYQWHEEGFTVPRGTTLLARGRVFENQMFSYGANAYGLQFHPEITPDILARWLAGSKGRPRGRGAQCGLEQRLRHAVHDNAQGRWLDGFLTRWLAGAPSVHRAQESLRDQHMGLVGA